MANCNFSDATWINANLTKANCLYGNFINVALNQSNFSETELEFANFEDSNLYQVIGFNFNQIDIYLFNTILPNGSRSIDPYC